MINSVKTNLFWLALFTIYAQSIAASDYTPAYIRQYRTIVINEMQRSGIPASIKMAQAILESGSGRSTLARQSNNHFGIKCGKNWSGSTVYREDDDYKNGLLVRSCFRAYDDPGDSFIAHSDFLLHNRRYGFLFDLDPLDYVSWARGLKKAGYASDPKYPSKLINLIEKYQLYNLDLGLSPEIEQSLVSVTSTRTQQTEAGIKTTNGKSKDGPIIIKTVQSPRSSYKYGLKDGYYTFTQGDKMHDIAIHFKMNIKELYFRNRLAYGAIPKVGERLSVLSYIHFKDIPDVEKSNNMDREDYLFEESITISSF